MVAMSGTSVNQLFPLAACLAVLSACVGIPPEPTAHPDLQRAEVTPPTEATPQPTKTPEAAALSALFEEGTPAIEKGDYMVGVPALEKYVNSFSY